MSARLPDTVDPWRLAARGAVLAGEIELGQLGRLSGVLQDVTGGVSYALRFRLDERGRVRIGGVVKALLTLECQRCLDPMAFPVDATLDLAVVEADAAAATLPETCEPVLADEGMLRISDLVEDELLLTLPQIAMHDPNNCKMPSWPTLDMVESPPQEGREDNSKASPFTVLADLKTDNLDNS